MTDKPTNREVLEGGSINKGGRNTTSQIIKRPPPPKPTKPAQNAK